MLFRSQNKKPSAVEVASLFKDDAAHPEEQPIVGFSIEGSKLNKEGIKVTHSIARKLTITCIPANKTCIAQLIPENQEENSDNIFKKMKDFFKSEEVLEKKDQEIPTSTNETNEDVKINKQKSGKKISTSKNETNEHLEKALEAGSMMAAPGSLVGSAALGKEELEKRTKKVNNLKKSDWSKKADEAYESWMDKGDFKKYMKERMPHLADGEVDAIGRILALKKEMEKDESLSKMYSSYFQKSEIENLEKGFKEGLLGATALIYSANPAHATSGHLHQYISSLKNVPGIEVNSDFKPLAEKSKNGSGNYSIKVGPYTIKGHHFSLSNENNDHEMNLYGPKEEEKQDPRSKANAEFIFDHLHKQAPKILSIPSNVEIGVHKKSEDYQNLNKAIYDEKTTAINPKEKSPIEEKTPVIDPGKKTQKTFIEPENYYVQLAEKYGIPKHWRVKNLKDLKNFNPQNPEKEFFDNSGQQHLIENSDLEHKLHPLLVSDIHNISKKNPNFLEVESDLNSLLSGPDAHPLNIKYFLDMHPNSRGEIGKRVREARVAIANNHNSKFVTPHVLNNLLSDEKGYENKNLDHKFNLAHAISKNPKATPEILHTITANAFRALDKNYKHNKLHSIFENISNHPNAPEYLKTITESNLKNHVPGQGLNNLAVVSKNPNDLKYAHQWTKKINLDEEGNPVPPPLPSKSVKQKTNFEPVFSPEESRLKRNEELDKTTDIMMVAEDKKVCLPEEEFKEEHEHLVDILSHPTKKKLKEEKEKQQKEIEKKEKPFHEYSPKKHSKSGGLNDKYREK